MQSTGEERFLQLLERYKQDQATAEEEQELFFLIGQPGSRFALERSVEEALGASYPEGISLTQTRREEILRAITGPRVRRIRWWAAAAAVLLMALAGGYLWHTEPSTPVAAEEKQDVAPGADKATLTLADGSVVTLDSAGTMSMQQGGTTISQQGGRLQYEARGETAIVNYNMLATPRGGQFRLTLPDGTGVWLNASSSIRFPTAFKGKERRVEITGEVYFEVAAAKGRPFMVQVSADTYVEVLGTDFNVNAYTDEGNIRTTLLTGSVKVSAAGKSILLQPGQQAVSGEHEPLHIRKANISQAVAWKDGAFDFNNLGLEAAMRQISRWYDVEVIYSGQIPAIRFGGRMQRALSLSQVLNGLRSMGLNFRIEEKKLIIIP